MNKKIIGTLCVLALTLAIGMANIGLITATEPEPGSSSDPVVTRSYVEKAIRDLKSELAKLGSGPAEASTYKVVDVEPGQKLIGKQGTELILRAGQGTAIKADLGGLQDVTAGTDITEGFIPRNHLLITPRDDKRGVRVTKQATFMVRGGYTIE